MFHVDDRQSAEDRAELMREWREQRRMIEEYRDEEKRMCEPLYDLRSEYEQGYDDYKRGVPAWDNPYMKQPSVGRWISEWNRGWHEAEAEAKKK